MLAVKLDVTSTEDAEQAVRAAIDRFGRIDVLVINAGKFYAGYFEELTLEQIERQLATNLIGPMSVARAVLPVIREQRSGYIVSISSGAGGVGFEFCSAYGASKFGLEGWMESLGPEVAPFGIHTTIVEPASFRTEVLTRESATYAESSPRDYADRAAEQVRSWEEQSGRPPFDPAELAQGPLMIASQESPPPRFIAGADAIALTEQKVAALQAPPDRQRPLVGLVEPSPERLLHPILPFTLRARASRRIPRVVPPLRPRARRPRRRSRSFRSPRRRGRPRARAPRRQPAGRHPWVCRPSRS
jgi:NAD(P)-dependent dehydrogenase (short-subunit alcohol dehydrogenase family)